MKILRFHIAAIAVCAVMALAASPVSAKDKWVNLTSKHFNIVSNADEGDTRQLALKLEQFHFVFSKLFNISSATTVPITVVVFKSDSSFKPFKPLYNGKPANLAGYFQGGQDEKLIALNINGNEEHPMALIFHEYTHLLTSLAPREWPLWFTEGIAEVYSTFDVKKTEVTLGAPVSRHVFLLRESKFIPFEALFGVRHNSPAYNEREKQGIFYAQSWALAHYLMFADKSARRDQLVEFLTLISRGMEPGPAFTRAFKTDFATMEKDLRRYVGNSSYSAMIYKLESAEGEKDMSLRQLAEGEAMFYLGNLLMRTNRMDEAETYFKQALQLDANLARPYEGLGFIAQRRNKRDEALEYFKQATARDSKNHLAHFYHAQALFNEAHGAVKPETGKKIVEELKAAISLMPGFAHAHYLLGATYISMGENLKEAAESMKTALRLAPQEKHYALSLAHAQVRMQDFAAARKTLEPLMASDADEGLKSSARSMIEMIEDYSRTRAAQENSVAPAPTPETASGQPEPTGKRAPTRAAGQPTRKIEGAQVIRGVLVSIECVRGKWTLVVNTTDQLLRFMVTDKEKLEFYSQDPQTEGAVGCGPVNKVAFIYFKPLVGKLKSAGDAVAVEFTR
jgi:tetratricopeptide (TPR) repeat protein